MPDGAQSQASTTVVNKTDSITGPFSTTTWATYSSGTWNIPSGYNTIINFKLYHSGKYMGTNIAANTTTTVERGSSLEFLNNTLVTCEPYKSAYNGIPLKMIITANNTTLTWDVQLQSQTIYSTQYPTTLNQFKIIAYYI